MLTEKHRRPAGLDRMARSIVWTLLLCAIAASANAKTLPVAGGRHQGQPGAPTSQARGPGPQQARNADIPLPGDSR